MPKAPSEARLAAQAASGLDSCPSALTELGASWIKFCRVLHLDGIQQVCRLTFKGDFCYVVKGLLELLEGALVNVELEEPLHR